MKKLIFLVGTRPEAIKLAPLILEAMSSPNFDPKVVLTNQHPVLAREALKTFSITPDFVLGGFSEGQSLATLSSRVLTGLGLLINEFRNAIFIVQGDTTSALSGGIFAFYSQIPLVHIEAGLRTNNRISPYPEEVNRQMIGRLADLHCAPTQQAFDNLIREGIPRNAIFLSGNTCTDAVRIQGGIRVNKENFKNKGNVLVTLHRRENQNNGLIRNQTKVLFEVFSKKFRDVAITVIKHPNPASRSQFDLNFLSLANVNLIEPLNYMDLIELLNHTKLIITDSGGLQEEATYLGIPTLILRNSTERQEAVDSGVCALIGDNESVLKSRIELEFNETRIGSLSNQGTDIFGDGYCSIRILNKIHLWSSSISLLTS